MDFHTLCDMAVEVFAGESMLTAVELEARVQNAYNDGKITESQCDWLCASLEFIC